MRGRCGCTLIGGIVEHSKCLLEASIRPARFRVLVFHSQALFAHSIPSALHRDRQAWSVHRACFHRCALAESSLASTNGFKCVALSTEDEENIRRCSRPIVHNRHSEVVLQNRSSFFLTMSQNLLCCSGIAAPAVLQNQLCAKTTCAANATPATLCVDRQLVEFQHRLIGKT